MFSFEEEVDKLTDAGLLTERQATAFVYREVELTPRQAAAAGMGIEPSTLDNYVADAKRKITSARRTIAELDAIRGGGHEPGDD